ncbi:hypothetical protein TcasGA2_TC034649 [Tribolium castaneum]|uniref:Uncharacterized protein n=1 Tax=Tribolium castaneum TaxID=7070 RepID=A0A139WJ90_TRICA|nr:hypothetical protein TcasGA2_TC034649 [Tribolium castaneum]
MSKKSAFSEADHEHGECSHYRTRTTRLIYRIAFLI